MAGMLMIQAAINRLDFWRSELRRAQVMGEQGRAAECARFVDEYENLIKAMFAAADPDDLPKA